jgi:hypothetical protein
MVVRDFLGMWTSMRQPSAEPLLAPRQQESSDLGPAKVCRFAASKPNSGLSLQAIGLAGLSWRKKGVLEYDVDSQSCPESLMLPIDEALEMRRVLCVQQCSLVLTLLFERWR